MELISSEYEIVNFVLSFLPPSFAFESMKITFLMNEFDRSSFNARGAIPIAAKINFGSDNLMA